MAETDLIQRSLCGGILILAILAIRAALLYRLPKRTFPVLWGVALLRLLLPFSFSSIFSVYALLQPTTESVIPGNFTSAVTEGASAASTSAAWTTVQNMVSGRPTLSAATDSRFPVLPAVWGIGVILCAAFFARAYLRCLQDFRCALPIEDDQIRRWLGRHRGGRSISVRQSDKVSAPLTYGVLHPVILLPRRLVQEDCRELEYVLQHEYVHICHYDAALKLAMVAALCIHWFNPLVWVMCGLLNLDIELACDEGVLHQFGEQSRAGYAMALIGMEERKRSLLPLYNGFSKNATEERILLIMKYKKITCMTGAAALLLILGITLIFATSPRKADAAGSLESLIPEESGTFQANVPPDPPQGISANSAASDSSILADSSHGSNQDGDASDGSILADSSHGSSQDGDASDGSITAGSARTTFGHSPQEPASSAPGSQMAGNTGSPYTLSYMQEGQLTVTPASPYRGDHYGILIPTEGWQLYAPDAWKWTANEQIQFWINDCSGSTPEQAISRLETDGYSQTEEDGIFTKESDGRIFFAEIQQNGYIVKCINYTYPSDSEYIEGFQTLVQSIRASFSIVPDEVQASLSEDGKQLQQLALAFWEAYLAGNAEALSRYLPAGFAQDIEVFPDGIDGHIAAEALLQSVKGLPETESAVEETCQIWLEFRPAAGADYLEYLALTAVRKADGWKVLSYGLEM